MTIALFAIIGATIKAGVAYWVVFGVYCAVASMRFLVKFGEAYNKQQKKKEK